MDGTVFGSIHLLHIKNPFVKVREFIRLTREQREMTQFGHNSILPNVFASKFLAIIAILTCQSFESSRCGFGNADLIHGQSMQSRDRSWLP
jgi:hypothetical protein